MVVGSRGASGAVLRTQYEVAQDSQLEAHSPMISVPCGSRTTLVLEVRGENAVALIEVRTDS